VEQVRNIGIGLLVGRQNALGHAVIESRGSHIALQFRTLHQAEEIGGLNIRIGTLNRGGVDESSQGSGLVVQQFAVATHQQVVHGIHQLLLGRFAGCGLVDLEDHRQTGVILQILAHGQVQFHGNSQALQVIGRTDALKMDIRNGKYC